MSGPTDPVSRMPSLLSTFLTSTQALIADAASARFGIAVSGGPDSMALLDLALAAFPDRVAAATIDHGLRADSATEAAMVAQWCADRQLPHAILRPDAPVAGNVQAWGRAQRYALLERWRTEQRLDWIMTAHHADDQLETMLMRLNRGSGLSGLAGVRGRTGVVLRPLLHVTKSQLLAYAQEAGLPYVNDPSNRDERFDRARMRSALASADWLDADAAARSADALAEAEAAIEWMVEGLAARHIQRSVDGWMLGRTDLPRELLRRLVLAMLQKAQPDMSPPRGETLDRAIAVAGQGGQSSIGGWLIKGGPHWIVTRAPPRR